MGIGFLNANPKLFKKTITDKIIKKLPFSLTESQKEVLNQINIDLANNKRMFRVLQGDVGCGKTIVALLSIANVALSKEFI